MKFDDLPIQIQEKIKKKQHNISSNLDLNQFGYRLKTRATSKSPTGWMENEYYKKLLEENRSSAKRKETMQQYSKIHKEEINARSKKWREENKERICERDRKYRQEHEKEIKEYKERNKEKIQKQIKVWQDKNREYVREKQRINSMGHSDENKERSKTFYWDHREENLKKSKEYRESKKGKQVKRKSNAKRRRNLGFHPLNEPIDGIDCDGHHIDSENVIYIPRELHQSIPHNLQTGKNMFEINMNAFEFLKQQKGIKI